MGVGGPLTLVVALGGALLVNSRLARLRGVYRTIFFAPVVTTLVAVAVVWRYFYHPRYGMLNHMLGAIGLPAIDWLGDPRWAMLSITLLAVWRTFGYSLVIFVAGLQAIPESLYEAARLDGASGWRQFVHITLPLLRPTMVFVTVINTVGFFQIFAEPYLMTRGGPLNATMSIAMLMYEQGFRWWNLGRAAAVAFVLFAFILALAGAAERALRKRRSMSRSARSRLPMHRGQRSARCPGAVDPGAAALDGLGVADAGRRGQPAAAAPAAERADAEHYRALFERLDLGPRLPQLAAALDRDHRDLAAVQLDGRLCLRQAAVPRPRPPVRDPARRPWWCRRRWACCRSTSSCGRMGLVNSYAGVMVAGIATVFGIFLVRQFAQAIPDELLDAARLDGASELRIYWTIVLPLLRPILVTLAVFTFLSAWNDFMWPLVVLTDEARQTLPVALANLVRRARAGHRADDGGSGGDGAAGDHPVPAGCSGSTSKGS